MQYLTVFATLLAVASADSYLYPVPSQKLQTPLLIVKAPVKRQPDQMQQYFASDSLGQYSYGYAEPRSTKQEVRTLDGITRGSYSYVDAHGLLQTVDYMADEEGFHVAATNLPVDRQEPPKAVTDTPEVVLARQQHLDAHKALLQGEVIPSSIQPRLVEDTAEVKAAKKEFFIRYAAEEEKQKLLQNSALLKSQGLVTSFASVVPFATALQRPASSLSSIKPLKKPVIANTPTSLKYNPQYAASIHVIPRFYLPVV